MDYRALLAGELARHGAVKRGVFTLSSGRTSDIYIDLRSVPGKPHLYKLALSLLYAEAYPILDRIEAILGVATGGIPWAAGLSMLSGLPAGYVRKGRKHHGTGRSVEGPGPCRALLVDDVATTGGSLASAVEALRGEGYSVEYAVVVVDREEGARERLSSLGVELRSVLTLSTIRRLSWTS